MAKKDEGKSTPESVGDALGEKSHRYGIAKLLKN